MSFAEASARAMAEEMRRDPTVWVLGEDVRHGGVFGQYKGLMAEFGGTRVVDTPIAEATIMGAGLGAALVGTRPVIEMRIADFVLPAMDELVNQIAKARYMFGGQARAALVVRMPHGLLKGSAAQHSQTIENWFVNVPGLVVLTPATATDLAAAIAFAIRSDDPVLIFDPKSHWKTVEDVPDAVAPLVPGKAVLRRAGMAATVVTWSQALPAVLAGVEASGIAADVIDLVSLWPWDRAAVAASVRKTGRLMVVQEGGIDGGFGNDVIAATLEDIGPAALKAVRRLGAPRIPVPFSPPLEAAITLTPERVRDALRQLCA